MAYHDAVKFIEEMHPSYVEAFADDCRRAAKTIKATIPPLDTLNGKVQWRSDAHAVYAQRLKETIDLLEGLLNGYEKAGVSVSDYVQAVGAAQAWIRDGVAAENTLGVLIRDIVRTQSPIVQMSDPLRQWNDLRSVTGFTDWLIEISQQDEINKVRDQAEWLWHKATQAYDDALRIEHDGRELATSGLNAAFRLLPDFLANSPFAAHIIDTSPWLKPADHNKYHVGPFVPPKIDFGHDDFPYDPNADPTAADYASLATWKAKLAGGEAFRPDLDDATDAYAHYLDASGTDMKIDYEEAYNEDAAIKRTVDMEIDSARAEAERIYRETGSTSFQMQGNPTGVGSLGGYPATENWQKTLGDHTVYGTSQVVIEGNKVTMKITVHAEDMYNFNKDAQDIATGAPDNDNGRFSTLGWAKEFRTYGEVERTITWTIGDAPGGTSTGGGAVSDRGGEDQIEGR